MARVGKSMPQPCSPQNAGNYVARHNPAVYFTGINPANFVGSTTCRFQPSHPFPNDHSPGSVQTSNTT